MDWGHLFFKFNGRANRAKFWIAALVYAVINVILAAIGYAMDQGGAFQAVNGILQLVILVSSIAVGVKRLHDRDKSGWYLLLFYVVPGVLVATASVLSMTMEDFHHHRRYPRSCGLRRRRLGVCRAGLPAWHHRRQSFRPRSADAGGDATADPDAGLTREFAGLTRRAKHLI